MTAAGDVYEIVLHDTAVPQSRLRAAFVSLGGLLTRRASPADPGGMIISVLHSETGDELFRHIEDMGDDEGHMLDGIQQDLASMTADDFAAQWGS